MVPSPPQLNFWPFKRAPKKPPPLHRALQGDKDGSENNDDDDDNNDDRDHQPSSQESDEAAFLAVQQLATKQRVRKTDAFQRNALHIACANQPDLDTVALLIDIYPKAIDQPDKVGRLPLHTACASRASLDVVEYLWRQNPDTVLEVTDRGVSRSTLDTFLRNCLTWWIYILVTHSLRV